MPSLGRDSHERTFHWLCVSLDVLKRHVQKGNNPGVWSEFISSGRMISQPHTWQLVFLCRMTSAGAGFEHRDANVRQCSPPGNLSGKTKGSRRVQHPGQASQAHPTVPIQQQVPPSTAETTWCPLKAPCGWI